jgi:hypothetical protein
VDERRKHAYRYLLYSAMLDIRPLAWLGWGWFRAWNPAYWRREGRPIRCAGAVADWLHNLAFFSAVNFQGFNEEWFWRDFESVRARHPESGLERYRHLFEQRASEPPESAGVTEPGATERRAEDGRT